VKLWDEDMNIQSQIQEARQAFGSQYLEFDTIEKELGLGIFQNGLHPSTALMAATTYKFI